MKTDYKNLNLFETLAVIFIMTGLMLTAIIAFSGLTNKQQSYFVSALSIFDLAEPAGQTVQDLRLAVNGEQKFMDQFYVAFTQLAAVEPETFQEPGRVLKKLADNYRQANSTQPQLVFTGKVAGAFIEVALASSSPPEIGCGPSEPPELLIPYSFEPINWQAVKQKINISLK